MALRLEGRPVGDVLVIQCHGRIVAGNDVYALHAQVGDSLAHHADVVLQLDGVEFVDSSGLGALVRLLQTARSKGGDLKLSHVPAMLRRSLEMTNLISQFELYDSVDEAITAAYLGSRYSRGMAGDARPRVLCLYESSDVRAGSVDWRRLQRNDGCQYRRREDSAQSNEGETSPGVGASAVVLRQTDEQGTAGGQSCDHIGCAG